MWSVMKRQTCGDSKLNNNGNVQICWNVYAGSLNRIIVVRVYNNCLPQCNDIKKKLWLFLWRKLEIRA